MASNKNESSLSLHFDPIRDALEFLEKLSPTAYANQSEGAFSSSIGAHMRHILDHYHALMLGEEAGYVDYTRRSRLSAVERDMELAKKQWQQIHAWLSNVTSSALKSALQVNTEHGPVTSSMLRELSFVSSHAVHHFAFMKQLAFQMDIVLSADVGVAPATLKDQQEQLLRNK